MMEPMLRFLRSKSVAKVPEEEGQEAKAGEEGQQAVVTE